MGRGDRGSLWLAETLQMKKRLAIVHFLPLEMYPPAINAARYFESHAWDVSLFTTANLHGRPPGDLGEVEVHRTRAPGSVRGWRRAVAYFSFHFGTFFRLLFRRPDVVLYVEPQSAFPVFLLSFFRRKLPLFIHHHEYHEPRQFHRPGMTLGRWFHGLEKWRLFSRARWISHTNAERMKFFLADIPAVDPAKSRLLPNYPPASWFSGGNNAWESEEGRPLKMVYVGSLSLRDTYIAEFVSWVSAQPPGTVEFHIWAYNLDEETRDFLSSHAGEAVKFHPSGIEYDELPAVLRTFHTGVILYRARTVNYRFNASNKLFEYLACGLDVIFPSTMEGVKPYARLDALPRVIEVDFETGSNLDLRLLATRPAANVAPQEPPAEDALERMEREMNPLVTS